MKGAHIRGSKATMGSPHRSAELGLIPKPAHKFFFQIKTTKLAWSNNIKKHLNHFIHITYLDKILQCCMFCTGLTLNMGFRVHTHTHSHRGADHAGPAVYIMKLQSRNLEISNPPPHKPNVYTRLRKGCSNPTGFTLQIAP